MSDLVQDLLERLRVTQGDAQAQAVVSADFALAVRETGGETRLRDAFDAAALLRWFDAARLARVLSVSEADAAEQFQALAALPFVEPYPETGASNVHEATRLGWRKRMAREQPRRFKELSARAAACFAVIPGPTERIEWIYHLLSTDPETASEELETLDRAWTGSAYPEHRQALALALAELETSSLLAGHARVEVLLCVAEASNSRGETAGLRNLAQTARTLAEQFNHASGLARAWALTGDLGQAEGKLPEARTAFREGLRISQQLATQDPGNTGWQRELAVAHSRLGGIWQAEGKLPEARTAFGEYLRISQQLAAKDPGNAGWQADLAVSLAKLGTIESRQGFLSDAVDLLAKAEQIFAELVKLSPSNKVWQGEHKKLGHGLTKARRELAARDQTSGSNWRQVL